jgi:hypothetical protein
MVVYSNSRSDSDSESEPKRKRNWLKSVKLAGNNIAAGRQEKLAGNHSSTGRSKWTAVLKKNVTATAIATATATATSTATESLHRDSAADLAGNTWVASKWAFAGNSWNMTGSIKSVAGKQQDDWAGKSKSRAAILRCERSHEALAFLAGMSQPTGVCICMCLCVFVCVCVYMHVCAYT